MKITKNKKFIPSHTLVPNYSPLGNSNQSLLINLNLPIKSLYYLLIKNPSLVNKIDNNNNTLLSYSIAKHMNEISELILTSPILDLNYQNNEGNSYLHLSVLERNYEISEGLIKKGIYINFQNNEGNTALHLAYILGDNKMIDLLLKNNIDFTIQNYFGKLAENLKCNKKLKYNNDKFVEKYHTYNFNKNNIINSFSENNLNDSGIRKKNFIKNDVDIDDSQFYNNNQSFLFKEGECIDVNENYMNNNDNIFNNNINSNIIENNEENFEDNKSINIKKSQSIEEEIKENKEKNINNRSIKFQWLSNNSTNNINNLKNNKNKIKINTILVKNSSETKSNSYYNEPSNIKPFIEAFNALDNDNNNNKNKNDIIIEKENNDSFNNDDNFNSSYDYDDNINSSFYKKSSRSLKKLNYNTKTLNINESKINYNNIIDDDDDIVNINEKKKDKFKSTKNKMINLKKILWHKKENKLFKKYEKNFSNDFLKNIDINQQFSFESTNKEIDNNNENKNKNNTEIKNKNNTENKNKNNTENKIYSNKTIINNKLPDIRKVLFKKNNFKVSNNPFPFEIQKEKNIYKSQITENNYYKNFNFINNSLYLFLSSINLCKYYNILNINGFDEINLLIEQSKNNNVVISDENLIEIGILLPGDRIKILIRIFELANNFSFDLPKNFYYSDNSYNDNNKINRNDKILNKNIIQLKNYLKNLKLERYLMNFINNGYYSLDTIFIQMQSKFPLTEKMFKNVIGIEKVGHRARLINKLKEDSKNYVNKLKSKMLIIDNDKKNNCGDCKIF